MKFLSQRLNQDQYSRLLSGTSPVDDIQDMPGHQMLIRRCGESYRAGDLIAVSETRDRTWIHDTDDSLLTGRIQLVRVLDVPNPSQWAPYDLTLLTVDLIELGAVRGDGK